MKTKNILMSILLVMGSIAAKAAGYPPELALVSQPVMVYNYNSITVYYDVENIGDYTYRGDICIYLDPDDGYSYAEEYVKVRPGRIKRIAVEIPSYRIDRHFTYTIMPYYTIGRELYSFTTFEYFEPIHFSWHGTRTEPWVVIHIGPRPRYYHRPGTYRFYYDGFRPPMPPPGHAMHPMDPMHHTYGYHHNNGGYPATHNEGVKPNGNTPAPTATVRPNPSSGGSMSSGNANTSNNSGSISNGGNKPATPRNESGSVSRPSTGTSSSGRTGNSGSSRVNNNSSNSRPSAGTSNSGRTGNSNVNRSSSSTNRSGNSGSSRTSSSSSNTRSSGTSTSTTTRGSSSSNRSSSGTSSRSSNSSSSRSGASTGSAAGGGRR